VVLETDPYKSMVRCTRANALWNLARRHSSSMFSTAVITSILSAFALLIQCIHNQVLTTNTRKQTLPNAIKLQLMAPSNYFEATCGTSGERYCY
jgi:hypothetical protein